jgi:CHAT domain-containing protein
VAGIETWLGLLFLQLNQLDAAKVHSDAALRAAREVGDKRNELDALVLRASVASRQSNGPETESMLSEVYREIAAAPSLRWEIENAFADMYESRRQPQQAELWYRKSIATFETQRASVGDEELRLPFFANGDALYRDYAESMIAAGRSDRALQLFDDVRARTLDEGLAPTRRLAKGAGARPKAVDSAPVDARAVARRLDATILFYALGPEKSYLWAVDHDGTHLFVLPAETEIAARVKRYQASILKSSDPLRDRDEDAQWLYTALVAPAEGSLHEGSRVFVVSSGSLNSFNMETLLKNGPRGLHYWIDDVRVTSASSIRLLARSSMQTAGAGAKKLLLIGDPLTAGSGYPPLANAAAEIDRVQKYFPAADKIVLSRNAAVPKAYSASGPEQASYIHFVSHGTASSSRPLDSAILLSPPSGQPDNFKLYARDIVRQPLHAQLVTISACYGSGLRNYEGEGLVGLSWAFLRAGAHHVIGALWEVNDASTPQLMDHLYNGLAAGHEPDDSLRDAKLAMMHSDGVYRKPLYWAAFQLYAGS